jgi:hypothetical protein
MRIRSALLASSLTIAALVPSALATAAPLDKGHFNDVFTSMPYDCEGTLAQDSGDIHVNFLFNQRGSNDFPYYRETIHGTFVTTNLDTGGTFTNVFSGGNKDQTVVDNGDGTITITVYAFGGSRYYDQNGNLVLKDPGNVRYAFDVNFNGTPGNPEDDTEVKDSFRIIRESTGRNDTAGREFCADLVQFTTP